MILGGIGFLPINDIVKNKTKKFNKLKLQSKIVIIYSIDLIIISTLGIKIFEGSNISWMNALFMLATTRNTGLYTAISSTGLTSTSMQVLNAAGKFILMILMFIGRIGPLSIFAIFAPESNKAKIDFPKEELIL